MQRVGNGRIVLEAVGDEAVFSQLSYAYPLKLLSPRLGSERPVGAAYVLNYGGGLVGGDEIALEIDVRAGTRLLLLTQGTTKIFKRRAGAGGGVTRQTMQVSVASGAALLLLPDAATCFREAEYEQIQTFRLEHGASAVILDALTAGRMSRGEEWDFARYSSVNEVWLGGRRLARDALLLAEDDTHPLRTRLRPYSCYATLLLVGPLLQPAIARMTAAYGQISQMRRQTAPDFIWSLSTIGQDAVLVRAAAKETQEVRDWLRETLHDLRDVLGGDAFAMAFG